MRRGEEREKAVAGGGARGQQAPPGWAPKGDRLLPPRSPGSHRVTQAREGAWLRLSQEAQGKIDRISEKPEKPRGCSCGRHTPCRVTQEAGMMQQWQRVTGDPARGDSALHTLREAGRGPWLQASC